MFHLTVKNNKYKQMKKISLLLLAFIATLSFNACSDDDEFTFVAKPDPEGIAFENTVLDSYPLEASNGDNLAERFVWNAVDFGVSTPVFYELQASTTTGFEGITVLGSNLSETNYGVTVTNMLSLAEEAGLDNDPETEAPNTGTLYFKVRAYVGSNGGNTVEQFSDSLPINVELVENTEEVESIVTTWGLVGDATPNGWDGPDVSFVKTEDPDVIIAYANLIEGEIKIRENNDWALNYGDTGADGRLEEGGDNIQVEAGSYKVTFNTKELTYTIEPFTWGLVGSATPNGWDGPDAALTYDPATDSWSATVTLVDGEMKFRQNNEWVVDYGDTGADGMLEQGGDNIAVSGGSYNVTVSFTKLTYTLEAQ